MSREPENFCVLLGPDHAGKSTVLNELRSAGFRGLLVSADDDHLPPEHALISRVRHGIIADVGAGLGAEYSADLLTSMAQTVIVYLRDRIRQAPPGQPVLVDSYYYKTLAKCRLAGAWQHPMFDWWRSFPQPDRIIYLDVDPSTAWERAGGAAGTHRLECRGGVGRAAFEEYQRELAKMMLDEVGSVPVTVLDSQGHSGPTALAAAVRRIVEDAWRSPEDPPTRMGGNRR
ncbi:MULTISPECIES: hypothetical protein [Protofrankia]|uniref:dTMP kinase n=1 Tax=Protofrankia TaxID=2994361 RepID=UPI0006404C00|nr:MULTISPECIES: hypothetical protein [Protofrankia]ONH35118.1 hypothetical protein BL254_13085 [Protofrankia sp. BMG5.30]